MILRSLEYYYSKILKKIRGCAIKNSKIHSTSKIEAGSTVINSIMEKYSYCGYNCTLINAEIGAFCSIADNVLIGQASHSLEWISTSPVFREKKDSIKKKYFQHPLVNPLKITIGNDVWIGEGVKVKSGVKIGNGVVVGMGSVVTRDLESYGIYAGNPAKIIRKRFDNEVIEKLERICWWNFDEKTLYRVAPYINDPLKFIEEVEKI